MGIPSEEHEMDVPAVSYGDTARNVEIVGSSSEKNHESHDTSSSSSDSSSGSSSSSSSSSKSSHHHHEEDGAHSEEDDEVVSLRNDAAHEDPILEEPTQSNGAEESHNEPAASVEKASAIADAPDSEESKASAIEDAPSEEKVSAIEDAPSEEKASAIEDAPGSEAKASAPSEEKASAPSKEKASDIEDRALGIEELEPEKEVREGALEEASNRLQGSEEAKEYHVVASESLKLQDEVAAHSPQIEENEGHGEAELAPEAEIAESEVDNEGGKVETSDVAVAESQSEEDESKHVRVLKQTQNSNASEMEGKSEHDFEGFENEEENEGEETMHRSYEVVGASPLNRLLKPTLFTPSPPKRENSVYKIVMALEGLQIGEKCIHGEIDHGVCHQRHGDKKVSSPGSFSRNSSTSPRDAGSNYASPEVRIRSDGESKDHEWSFVQHDSTSSDTQVMTSSTKTETYTDTVLFRRDEGFLPRTPGRSPLSQQSMRAVFNQVESSEAPTLKIVHEFPAESSTGTTESREGESEVERILRLQETHDLVCPVCRSCITKRVILRKRKRTSVVSSVEKWENEAVEDEESSGEQVVDTNVGSDGIVVEEYENYGCLSCFTFLFRRERSTQRTEVLEVPRAPDAAPAAPVVTPVDQSSPILPPAAPVATPVDQSSPILPPAPTAEDYDNRCLPIFFTWRRKTTVSTDPEIVAPLLSHEERAEDSVVHTETSRDVSGADLTQQSSTSETKESSTSETKESSISETKESSTSEIKDSSISETKDSSISEIKDSPTSENQESSTSDSKDIAASEIKPAEIQRPDAGTLTLPAAPEGVQIPVVVVETKEDRLCFPFLWRRGTKSIQVHPELVQPLLTKEDVEPKPDESTETKRQTVTQESQQTEDFSRIEDDLWMHKEVLLEVPVSVAPQEEPKTPDTPPADTPVRTTRVTEEERRADCLCFPSWSSSETTTEETEIGRVADLQQGALSTWPLVTEATEKVQTSTSQRIAGSSSTTDEKKIVTTTATEGSEITLSSPSLKGAVLPVASSTPDREQAQKASLNCMEIIIPSYPWGPPGAGRLKEEHAGDAAFQFSTVVQSGSKSPLILPVAESSTQPGSQLNQEIVVARSIERREDSTCFPLSLPTRSWRRQEIITREITDGSSKTEAAEVKPIATQSESTASATSDKEITVTSETSSSKSKYKETKKWVTIQTNTWGSTESILVPVLTKIESLERKPSEDSESKTSFAETGEITEKDFVVGDTKPLESKSESKTSFAETGKIAEKDFVFGDTRPLESKSSVHSESKTSFAETGKIAEKDFVFGDIEVSRNQGNQSYNTDTAVELVDEEEEEPLVRKPKKLTPSEVEPLLPVETKEQVIVSEEIDNNSSSVSEILERDLSFSQDLTRTENSTTTTTTTTTVLPVGEDEKGSWNCCLPSYSSYQPLEDSVTPKQAALPGASVSQTASESLPGASVSQTVSDSTVQAEDSRGTIFEEETREMGSWSCCLPSYSQIAYQPLEVSVPPGASVSEKKETHEEVTKQTTIDARIKTEVKTSTFSTDEHHTESIDSVRVDTRVSYVHGKIQHDQGNAEGTLLLDDHPTLTFHPVDSDQDSESTKTLAQPPLAPAYSTGFAALSRFMEDDEADAEITDILVQAEEAAKSEVEQDEVEEPEAVREVKQEELEKSAKTDQDVGKEVPIVPEVVTMPQPDISLEQERRRGIQEEAAAEEEDGSCCGPSSKWFWGRRKFTTEEAQLRQPLLGREEEQSTALLRRDSEADSQDSAAHVTIHQTHDVTETRMGDTVVATDEVWCQPCFPWTVRQEVTDTVETTVTVTTDDTVIEVEGTDATSTLAAATQAAEDAGMVMEEPLQEGGYLKSIVYGGLDVSLTSLGVVAAAAGGDAKTRNILALGLSNLIYGFLAFFYKIQDLHKEHPARFHESVGPRFWVNGPLAMLSFLFFGALPVLTFAFSFRELNDHDYKMAATVVAATIAVTFLGCGKVAAKMTTLSYRRTLFTLISTGIVASVAGFYTGEYISYLLKKYGILDQ